MRFFSRVLDLLYPNLCFACKKNNVSKEKSICLKCEYKISSTNYHKMPDNPVSERFFGRVDIHRASTAFSFSKGGLVQDLVHSLKYENKPEIGIELGKIYGAVLKEHPFWSSLDMIIPVPLHPKKEFQRGYNQAERWGKGLSEVLKIPVNKDILIRTDYSESQTKKARMDRFQNVQDVFKVNHPEKLTGKRIMIVDDVLTTGATIEACASRLLSAANVEVNVVCISLAG
jgi:ComF family protein